jgi:hypothetical protein
MFYAQRDNKIQRNTDEDVYRDMSERESKDIHNYFKSYGLVEWWHVDDNSEKINININHYLANRKILV